jgi:hypothetical protein
MKEVVETTEVVEMTDAEWIDRVQAELAPRFGTIAETLDDVKQILDAEPLAWWVELAGDHAPYDPERAMVYVISSGFLHVVTGPRETVPDPGEPDARLSSSCAYRVLPIEPWAWKLEVARTYTASATSVVVRTWSFELPAGAPLVLKHDPSDVPPRRNPTLFARALIREILRAGAEEE